MPASLLYCKQFATVSKLAFKVQNDISSLSGDLLHYFDFYLTLNNLKLRLVFFFQLKYISMVDIFQMVDNFLNGGHISNGKKLFLT